MAKGTFVTLTVEDCSYLLELIASMDADTRFTEKQRGYTVPKLLKMKDNPDSARLAFQDVDYLLELIEDDDLESCEQQREMTRSSLLDIQKLQAQHFNEQADIESQRETRRARRTPAVSLQEHFPQTT